MLQQIRLINCSTTDYMKWIFRSSIFLLFFNGLSVYVDMRDLCTPRRFDKQLIAGRVIALASRPPEPFRTTTI